MMGTHDNIIHSHTCHIVGPLVRGRAQTLDGVQNICTVCIKIAVSIKTQISNASIQFDVCVMDGVISNWEDQLRSPPPALSLPRCKNRRRPVCTSHTCKHNSLYFLQCFQYVYTFITNYNYYCSV